MLHRNRFKKSRKSPFDESGPNADALRRSLEWLERHDRDVPSPDPSVELRKKPDPASVEPASPAQPEEAAIEEESPQTETQREAKPSAEEPAQTEPANAEETEAEPAETETTQTEPLEAQPEETEPIEAEAVEAAATDEASAQAETLEPEPIAAEPEPEPPSTELVESEAILAEVADADEAQIEASEVRRLMRPSRSESHLDPRRFGRPHSVRGAVDLSKHVRSCCICRHTEREAIEEGFLQWRRVADLRYEYALPNRSCIYRHAHALGLFDRRAQLLRFGLENIIEESSHCLVTAESVIRAIRAYSCLDENGRWTEPPRRVIITRETLPKPPRRKRNSTKRRGKPVGGSRNRRDYPKLSTRFDGTNQIEG